MTPQTRTARNSIRFIRDERGLALPEYLVLTGLLSAGLLVAVFALRDSLGLAWEGRSGYYASGAAQELVQATGGGGEAAGADAGAGEGGAGEGGDATDTGDDTDATTTGDETQAPGNGNGNGGGNGGGNGRGRN